MKQVTRMILLAAMACLFLAQAAWAQDSQKSSDYQVFDLGEVVVSEAGGSAAQVATVTSFTAGDIERTHSLTVPEALSYIPGVTVTTGFKNEPSIRIHGFQQYEALILIDGVPYYESNYGKLNLNQLPTEMIARIDVVKGAPSVLYGPGAMGGVINIITKTAGDRPTISASGEVGNDGAYRLSATHGNSLGKFKYWVSAARRELDGWRMSEDFEPQQGRIVRRPGGTTRAVLEDGGLRNNSDSAQTSLWAKAGLELGPDSKYYLSTFFIDSQWGFPVSTQEVIIFPSRPAFSRFSRMDKYQDWGLDLSGVQRITDSLRLRGKLFYHDHEDDLVSFSDLAMTKRIATSTYQDYILGTALFADWDLAKQDSLHFAFHYRADSHKEKDDAYLPFAESLSYTGSLAMENQWRPLTGLLVTAGVSYDWFQVDKAEANETNNKGDLVGTESLPTGDTKQAFNPMVGVSYQFSDQTSLFASVARKTRFPTLQQLFASKGGNLELDPQTSMNYTLGVSRPLGKIATAQASVFYYDISDRISRDAPYPDAMFHNYASVGVLGGEISGEVTPFTGLTLRLGYTYLRARDESEDRVTDDVTGVPEHKIDLGVSYTVPKLATRLHLEGMFLGEHWSQLPTPASPDLEALKNGSYFLANFQITQPIGDHLEAFAFVNNILDKDYESESGFPGPGRNFWLGLRTSF